MDLEASIEVFLRDIDDLKPKSKQHDEVMGAQAVVLQRAGRFEEKPGDEELFSRQNNLPFHGIVEEGEAEDVAYHTVHDQW